ncbi:permease [Paenibacillus antibioticophila]|uniref:Permease n=1 Tax=Paenibacillus antibioticophila TaxID=1274374 RepID=A0A919XUU4_9BACL|nr:permease [Paenibacillus antibioticophila]GIO39424.1 permease [Paenibacillus antibioticophila]
MAVKPHVQPSQPTGKDNLKTAALIAIFLIIAIAGLTYVKWWPYYNKAIHAALTRSIGASILNPDTTASPSWGLAIGYATAYFKSVWKAALLGILLGSLVQVLLPSKWLYRVLGRSSFRSTLLGGTASLPGMMCSCCAAPVAAGFRRRNVSVGAALAFWIGNPVLNPATLIFMTFVLSWKFTLLRVVFGLILTFGVSHLANRIADRKDSGPAPEAAVAAADAIGQDEESRPFLLRWLKSLGFMILNVVPAYLISVLLLGAFQNKLFPVSLGSGIIAIIVFAVVGALFVIPTAAEIPIIQSFTAMGLGMGPAAALLLTLPAISLPSLLMLTRSFSRATLLFVLGSVVLIGIVGGLAGSILL